MKNKKFQLQVIFIVVVVFCSFFIEVQARQKNDQLFGTWVLDLNASMMAMPSAKKSRYDTLKNETKQRVVAFYKEQKFVFDGRGGYRLFLASGGIRKGVYNHVSTSLFLTDSESNQEIKYRIKKVDSKELILIMEGVKSKTVILSELHFRQVKS